MFKIQQHSYYSLFISLGLYLWKSKQVEAALSNTIQHHTPQSDHSVKMFWSLSYDTYDTITVCSLGSLVIFAVAGSAIFMGISQGGGWKYHKQVTLIDTWSVRNASSLGWGDPGHVWYRELEWTDLADHGNVWCGHLRRDVGLVLCGQADQLQLQSGARQEIQSQNVINQTMLNYQNSIK